MILSTDATRSYSDGLDHFVFRKIVSTAMTSVVIGAKIPIAMVTALVIAVSIAIVASWDDHTATEQYRHDRKNEDVFHDFSRLNMIDWIKTWLEPLGKVPTKGTNPPFIGASTANAGLYGVEHSSD